MTDPVFHKKTFSNDEMLFERYDLKMFLLFNHLRMISIDNTTDEDISKPRFT